MTDEREKTAREVLRKLEWKGPRDNRGRPTCPLCRGIMGPATPYGHQPTCRLAAALSAIAPPDGGEPTPGTAQGVVADLVPGLAAALGIIEETSYSSDVAANIIERIREEQEAARLRTASPTGGATDGDEPDPRHALLLADAKARAAGKDLDGSERRETVEEQFDRMGAERSIVNTKLHVPPAPASVTDEKAMVVLNIFDPEWRSEPSALNNLRMMKEALTAVWPTTQPTAMQETAEAERLRPAFAVGDHVQKIGNKPIPDVEIVSVFLDGAETRYVARIPPYGLLHIYAPSQLRALASPAQPETDGGQQP